MLEVAILGHRVGFLPRHLPLILSRTSGLVHGPCMTRCNHENRYPSNLNTMILTAAYDSGESMWTCHTHAISNGAASSFDLLKFAATRGNQSISYRLQE